MTEKGEALFSSSELRNILPSIENDMFSEIKTLPSSTLLNTSPEDLAIQMAEKHKLDIPELQEKEIVTEQKETQVDVSGESGRIIRDRNRPHYISGTEIAFTVPFTGNVMLFRYQPSSYSLSPIFASFYHSNLLFTYQTTDHNAEKIRSSFDRDFTEVKRLLRNVRNDVEQFNSELHQKALGKINARRTKILKDQGLVASLGFPLKKRDDAPQTYVTPEVRRKPKVKEVTSPKTEPFKPEPVLDMQDYEHILSVVSSMVKVMERSPNAFSGMKEEELRSHFLVQLNGHYQGQATGETFNFEGKTDILIRAKDKNIFIAECKFWKGPKSLINTIDQILSYVTWRDTKTAIILFCKGKDFSKIIEKIPESVKKHSSFKREEELDVETVSRYIFGNEKDSSRELMLTILAFHIPQ